MHANNTKDFVFRQERLATYPNQLGKISNMRLIVWRVRAVEETSYASSVSDDGHSKGFDTA